MCVLMCESRSVGSRSRRGSHISRDGELDTWRGVWSLICAESKSWFYEWIIKPTKAQFSFFCSWPDALSPTFSPEDFKTELELNMHTCHIIKMSFELWKLGLWDYLLVQPITDWSSVQDSCMKMVNMFEVVMSVVLLLSYSFFYLNI